MLYAPHFHLLLKPMSSPDSPLDRICISMDIYISMRPSPGCPILLPFKTQWFHIMLSLAEKNGA